MDTDSRVVPQGQGGNEKLRGYGDPGGLTRGAARLLRRRRGFAFRFCRIFAPLLQRVDQQHRRSVLVQSSVQIGLDLQLQQVLRRTGCRCRVGVPLRIVSGFVCDGVLWLRSTFWRLLAGTLRGRLTHQRGRRQGQHAIQNTDLRIVLLDDNVQSCYRACRHATGRTGAGGSRRRRVEGRRTHTETGRLKAVLQRVWGEDASAEIHALN
eukprot:scaffold97_cov261-Pinguiococcus_pyrenoidosus.AAC.36